MALSQEFLEDLAYEMVRDHVLDGIEYISFSEALEDSAETGYEEDDVEKLADIARKVLNELAGYL